VPRAAFDADAAGAEAELRRFKRSAQNLEQVGAVHGKVRRAEFLPEIAALGARNITAALPAADVEKIGFRRDPLDRVLEVESAQCLDRIGREIEPGANLAQRARLLAHDGLGAAPLQRQRRSEPADTAADDGDARGARHGFFLPFCRRWSGIDIRVKRCAAAAHGGQNARHFSIDVRLYYSYMANHFAH
jgi:hypothetical protein